MTGADPIVSALVLRHGERHRERITRGMQQVRAFWREADGSEDDLSAFAHTHFVAVPQDLQQLRARLEFVLQSLHGHLQEVGRDLRWHTDLEHGTPLPVDDILSGYDPGAHFVEDAFANKLAFVVLLNFTHTSLQQRLAQGSRWSRSQWAQMRLVDLFSRRIPAHVQQAMAQASGRADRYIASYNICADRLRDHAGQALFEPGKTLLAHWNLRDEIKARYAQGTEGLPQQRALAQVMEHIVTQRIPAAVINQRDLEWNPWSNEVYRDAVCIDAAPEPDTRYQVLLDCFHAARQADAYSPLAPSHIARSFELGRQLPQARVVQMLHQVCASDQVARTARLIAQRLGRPLEPFDIWYSGFRTPSALGEAELDALTRSRFPDAAAFHAALPQMLERLGFSAQRAQWLAQHIEVDPARGSGHAMGAAHRAAKARLRTRIAPQGMDYKGFNIAVHELGHNVEQTFSMQCTDHWLLSEVPNTAFTEAIAFVFQARDLLLLDQAVEAAPADKALNDLWATFEIAGVGLVDIAVWQWMYEHPQASAAQLKEAVLNIAMDVWNRYYAPVLGHTDCVLLAIYSHMVHSFLYLPDYAIGHMIASQIEQHIAQSSHALGVEVERLAIIGRLTPDLWMQQATGQPVGPQALLAAAEAALAQHGH